MFNSMSIVAKQNGQALNVPVKPVKSNCKHWSLMALPLPWLDGILLFESYLEHLSAMTALSSSNRRLSATKNGFGKSRFLRSFLDSGCSMKLRLWSDSRNFVTRRDWLVCSSGSHPDRDCGEFLAPGIRKLQFPLKLGQRCDLHAPGVCCSYKHGKISSEWYHRYVLADGIRFAVLECCCHVSSKNSFFVQVF